MVPIVQNLVSTSKHSIKCPYAMTPTRIVVHNTANDASAANEIKFMLSNNNEVSFHYAVDDRQIVQGVPLNRNTWNAGDGNGKGNREGISIEICYSLSGGDRFVQAEKNAAEFIAQLIRERGWGIDKVTKHQDYNGKYCPHRTLDMGWQRFLNMVQSYLAGDTTTTVNGKTLYRVRASWADAESQKGAFTSLENAKKCADQYGCKVYDANGNQVYPVSVPNINVNANAVGQYGPNPDVNKYSYEYDAKVKELQQLMNKYDNAGLATDGLAGPKTYHAMGGHAVKQGYHDWFVRWVQERLNTAGYNCGTADGIAGANTMAGIAAFQRHYGLGVGYLGGTDRYYLIEM